MLFSNKWNLHTVLTLCILTIAVGSLLAQESAADNASSVAPAAQAVEKKNPVRVSFRALNANQKTALHVHDAKKADETEKLLKEIGCITSRHEHDGHMDLMYECRFWRSIELKDQAKADHWIQWLTKHKFAVVENTPPKTRKETVDYHCKDWRTVHPRNAIETKMYAEMFKMLGCEVKTTKHNGHDDVRFRCTEPKTLGVATHQLAHAWIVRLNQLGFVTEHEH